MAPRNATSTRTLASASPAQSPTAASVRDRTRPPVTSTCRLGRIDKLKAIGSELVTTVSSQSSGSISAIRAVVVPESSRIAPSTGSSAMAALAIRSFSS